MAEKKNVLQMWGERFKNVEWGGVLIEDGKLSIGRVMAWTVFSLLVYMWTTEASIPPTLVEAFWGLLIYNGGKKITAPLRDFITERKATKDLPEE